MLCLNKSFFAHSTDVPLTLGLIVDFSGSQDQFSEQHERDLQVFLKDVLGTKDRVFVVCFGNHVRLVSDFSQSGTQIIEQLDHYMKRAILAESSPRVCTDSLASARWQAFLMNP